MKQSVVLPGIVGFLLCIVSGRPQDQQSLQQSPSQTSTPVPIINQTGEVGPDGSFSFSYETGNGIHFQQQGFVKPSNETKDLQHPEESRDIQVLQGAYSYTAPDGQIISLQFVADENGYQPQGDHIPTPPPIPDSIARSLEHIERHGQTQQNQPIQTEVQQQQTPAKEQSDQADPQA